LYSYKNAQSRSSRKSHNASEGGLTLGAKNLYELIANAPGDEITLKKADNHWAEIKSGKVTYRIVGMPDRDFPKVHMACAYGAGALNFYWNGVKVQTLTVAPGALVASSSGVGVGAAGFSGENIFGAMDEFKMWDTARTDQQICSDACGSYSVPSAHLMGCVETEHLVSSAEASSMFFRGADHPLEECTYLAGVGACGDVIRSGSVTPWESRSTR
jgi:hypothetical protein